MMLFTVLSVYFLHLFPNPQVGHFLDNTAIDYVLTIIQKCVYIMIHAGIHCLFQGFVFAFVFKHIIVIYTFTHTTTFVAQMMPHHHFHFYAPLDKMFKGILF